MVGEGGHNICNASLSQPNVIQKNSRAHVGGGGGLKI